MSSGTIALEDANVQLVFDQLVEEVHFWKLVYDEFNEIKTWELIYINPSALKTWQRETLSEIKGQTADDIFGPGAVQHYMPIVKKIMADGVPHSFQDYFPNLNKYFRFTSVPLGDCFITTGEDITEDVKQHQTLIDNTNQLELRDRERTSELETTVCRLQNALVEADGLRQELKQQAIRDPLTGLFNRRYVEEFLERELRRAKRSKYSLGFIFFDIDFFKPINDQLGHEAGDVVLREIGRLLKRSIRGGDVACRYGGDEFLLILPETSLAGALKLANQLRKIVQSIDWQSHDILLDELTISCGVADFPNCGSTAGQLIKAADLALYQAKSNGRNNVASLALESA